MFMIEGLGLGAKTIVIGACGEVEEGGVGTQIPLLRFIKGLLGFIRALSEEYGPQHPLPNTPPSACDIGLFSATDPFF